MVVLHTGLLVGCRRRGRRRRPPVPRRRSAGRCSSSSLAARACAGGASRPSGPSGTPGSSSCPATAWSARGPYRLLRHPNYVAVVVEGVALPLVHTAWVTALVFTGLNAALLTVRIRVEERALGPRGAMTRRPARHRRAGPWVSRPRCMPSAPGSPRHVIEPRPDPLDKACGEGLMPGGLRALAELGVDPAGHPFLGIRYLGRGASAVADFSSGPGRGVRRTYAAQRPCRGGRRGRRGAVRRWPPPTSPRTRSGSPCGRVTRVAPTGRCSGRGTSSLPTACTRGPAEPSTSSAPRPGAARYGLRRHFAIAPWSSHVDVHLGRRGRGLRHAGGR